MIVSDPCGVFVVTVIVAVANAALTLGRGHKEVKGRKEVEEGTIERRGIVSDV